MGAWNEVERLRREREDAARNTEKERVAKEAGRARMQAQNERAREEKRQRDADLLSKSGVVDALRDIKYGMPSHPTEILETPEHSGSASLKYGHIDRYGGNYSEISVWADSDSGAIYVAGEHTVVIPKSELNNNSAAVSQAVASAYLNPRRTEYRDIEVVTEQNGLIRRLLTGKEEHAVGERRVPHSIDEL